MRVAIAASTVGDALAAAVDALGAAGVEAPRLDAELLLAEAAGTDREQLLLRPEAAVEAPVARRFGSMVRRRLRREPVAYILGRKGFRRLELAVDARALIPRPETELLVELAAELDARTVLDVGTGSGAIALAVAEELVECAVRAVDSSPGAIALARENAARLGLADRIAFERVELGRLGPRELGVDLVLANLPYVSEREWRGLAPEITGWEPAGALVAGVSGLEALGRLLARVEAALGLGRGPSAVGLEVGASQGDAVAELVERAGYVAVELRQDLAGLDRVVVGRRR